MPENDRSNPLPEELARALRRATDRTLIALTALRLSIRDHVHKERADGNDLDGIQVALREIIAHALQGMAAHDNADNDHSTVTREIMQWSEAFYTEEPPHPRRG